MQLATSEPGWRVATMWIPARRRRIAGLALLATLAIFAFAWAIARASAQSVTGDEGDTYNIFVARAEPAHWSPAANNHILNSMLIRLTTSVFGLSHLSLRAPALLGAAIYISIAAWFCLRIAREWRIRIPLFICLVYNPLIFDYYVAARGYSLALAFLLCAFAIHAWAQLGLMHKRARPLVTACAVGSAFLALSFSANFAFAFVDAVTLGALTLWALRSGRRIGTGLHWRILAASLIPGLIVTLLIPSWALAHWTGGELTYGIVSAGKVVRALVQQSLFEPNAHLLNPFLLGWANLAKPYLVKAVFALALIYLVVRRIPPRSSGDHPIQTWRRTIAIGLGAILGITALCHWLMLVLFRVPLPSQRTGIFFAALFTMLMGSIVALPACARAARISRGALIVALSLVACYFLFCMRLKYFGEWKYQADIQKAYDVVACYNHYGGVTDVEVAWWYHAAMNFYRVYSRHEALLPFTSADPHPAGKQMYVLNGAFENEFREKQSLKIVYHGEITDLIIAVPPQYALPPGACVPPAP